MPKSGAKKVRIRILADRGRIRERLFADKQAREAVERLLALVIRVLEVRL